MTNRLKLLALVGLALLAEGGLLFNSYMLWGGAVPEGIVTMNMFFKDVVLTIVGFLAGASVPSNKDTNEH